MVRGEIDENSSNVQARKHMARCMSEKCWQKENQHWAKEKPKLDNARKRRRIKKIDPEDMEFKEIMQNCATQKVGIACGFCNAVQIAKDLPDALLEGSQRPTREREMLRCASARRNLSQRHLEEKQKLLMHARVMPTQIYKKAHSRDSKQRSWRSHC